MAIATAGYVRLYDVLGGYTPTNGKATLTLQLDTNISVRIMVGSEPFHRYVLLRVEDRKFMPPTGPTAYDSWVPHATTRVMEENAPISDPPPLFTEVHCWTHFEISDQLAAVIEREDEGAKSVVLAQASNYWPDLATAADLAAGLVGLRVHKQLVLQFASDAYFVESGTKAWGSTHSKHAEPLDPLILRRELFEQVFTDIQDPIFGKSETWRFNAALLRWLLIAWGEQDDVNRFIALFLPLELLLAGQSPNELEDTKSPADQSNTQLRGLLKHLIHKHSGQHARTLRNYLDTLEPKRPALLARFAAYAKKTGLPNWESDVEQFDRFNKMRNDLFHGRGLSAFDYETLNSETEATQLGKLAIETAKLQQALRKLTDLTERYISRAIFGDTNIYLSRDRRKGIV